MKQTFVFDVFPALVNVLVLAFFLGVAGTYGGNVSIIPPQVTKSGIGTGEEGWNFICWLTGGTLPVWGSVRRPSRIHKIVRFLSGNAFIFPPAPAHAHPPLLTTLVGANDAPSSFWSASLPMLPAHGRARPGPFRGAAASFKIRMSHGVMTGMLRAGRRCRNSGDGMAALSGGSCSCLAGGAGWSGGLGGVGK